MPRIPVSTQHCAVRLRATVSNLHRQMRAALPTEGIGIGIAKLSVLGHLYRAGPLTPTDLARRDGVKLQTLTRLLAELEVENVVVRTPHESDRRQTRLSLTQAGVQLLTAHVHQREASLARAIGLDLSPDEQALLLQACALIDRVADRLAAEPEGSENSRQGA
ncbi:MAG: MarR family transcriptional regulator [Comamonadaceae bacterium]|nr:MAG: MarR family transcriptional regulator [Comamonadaceae bacterium]